MKWSAGCFLLATVAFFSFAACSRNMDSAGARGEERVEIAGNFARLPAAFEENRGQVDERVRFLSRGRGWNVYVTPDEIVMAIASRPGHGGKSAGKKGRFGNEGTAGTGSSVSMAFVGAYPGRTLRGARRLPGKSNYLIGNDPAKWLTGVPRFSRVSFGEIYRGVSLELYGTENGMEYDFTLLPKIDPATIVLRFSGAGDARIDGDGNVVIVADAGKIIHRSPRIYQVAGGGRKPVAGGFRKVGVDRFGFVASGYDETRELVIDPEISFVTYLGGARLDEALALALDNEGNAVVAGRTFSDDFPTTIGAFDPDCGTDGECDGLGVRTDAFVTRFNATGSSVIFSTYIGGDGDDSASGIAVGSLGNVFVAGATDSSDFPLFGPFFQGILGGKKDAFVAKLNPLGTALVYSTLLGGLQDDEALGLAVGSAGSAYVTGRTFSDDFPTTIGAFDPDCGTDGQCDGLGVRTDAFVTRVDTETDGALSLIYSTYLGGKGNDAGFGIALGAPGNAYITGLTRSDDFPTKGPQGAFQGSPGGFGEAFVAKVDTETGGALSLIYSTYLGGDADDRGSAIGVDFSGNAYVTGETTSSDFPLQNPFQGERGGGSDAFVTKLNASGSALVYSTLLGGAGFDTGSALAVTSNGIAYVTGRTASTDFPVLDPIQGEINGSDDAFAVKVKTSGSELEYATYLGGSGPDWGRGVAFDSSSNVYVAGHTDSNDFLVDEFTDNAFQGETQGNRDAFVLKIQEKRSIQRFDVVSGCGVSGQGGIDGDGFIPAYVLVLFAALFWAAGRRRKR